MMREQKAVYDAAMAAYNAKLEYYTPQGLIQSSATKTGKALVMACAAVCKAARKKGK